MDFYLYLCLYLYLYLCLYLYLYLCLYFTVMECECVGGVHHRKQDTSVNNAPKAHCLSTAEYFETLHWKIDIQHCTTLHLKYLECSKAGTIGEPLNGRLSKMAAMSIVNWPQVGWPSCQILTRAAVKMVAMSIGRPSIHKSCQIAILPPVLATRDD